DKRRCNGGVYALARLNGADDLEDLRLVRNRAKRAVDQTHAAGNALFIINFGLAVLIAADCVYAAGCRARALLADDGLIRAHVNTAAALDALFLIDTRTAVVAVERDRALGADLDARVRQTALTSVGDHNFV